jgi:hypothetical protein
MKLRRPGLMSGGIALGEIGGEGKPNAFQLVDKKAVASWEDLCGVTAPTR